MDIQPKTELPTETKTDIPQSSSETNDKFLQPPLTTDNSLPKTNAPKIEHSEEENEGASPNPLKKAKSPFTRVLNNIQSGADAMLDAADDALQAISAHSGWDFVPLKIPIKRRRQTFAVLVYSCMPLMCLLLNFIALRYWTGFKFYAYLAYIGYKIFYQTFHCDGGLPIPWFRDCFFWKWFCDYFPIKLLKTYELPCENSETYLFGYHPHGIIGMGAFGVFACSGSSTFEKLFPGIDVRLLTLRINFYIPFFDLFLSFLGVCDASRESCTSILQGGKSLCLVLGGAKESLEANPGKVQLYLKQRKGFVKIALENGSSLVPVFAFGENELYSQVQSVKGSLMHKLQSKLQNKLGFAMPIFHGRGIFQYNFGLLARRMPINVVFGKPIKCPKIEREMITNEIICKYHMQYCQALKALFDEHKSHFYRDLNKGQRTGSKNVSIVDKQIVPELSFI